MKKFERELGELIEPANVRRAGAVEYPLLSMTMRNGLVNQSDKFKKRVASADTSAYKVVRRGQLVVGFPIDEGVLAFQRLYDDAAVSPAYEVWDIQDGDEVSRRYIERYLRSPRALQYYAAKLQGSTARRRSLPRETFLGLKVPVPSMGEQVRIANLLDQVDALREKRREALSLLDDLGRVIFLDMFGDPATNPRGWAEAKLGDLSRVVRGASPRPKGDPRYFGGDIPWLMISDVTKATGSIVEKVREGVTTAGRDKSIFLPRGTLIVTNSATVGIPKFLGVDACIHDGFLALLDIAEDVEPLYLYHVFAMSRNRISDLAPEGTQKNLNTGIAKALKIQIPPREQQRAFLKRCESLDGLLANHRQHLATLDELFVSLQQRAFSGALWDQAA